MMVLQLTNMMTKATAIRNCLGKPNKNTERVFVQRAKTMKHIINKWTILIYIYIYIEHHWTIYNYIELWNPATSPSVKSTLWHFCDVLRRDGLKRPYHIQSLSDPSAEVPFSWGRVVVPSQDTVPQHALMDGMLMTHQIIPGPNQLLLLTITSWSPMSQQ